MSNKYRYIKGTTSVRQPADSSSLRTNAQRGQRSIDVAAMQNLKPVTCNLQLVTSNLKPATC
jgi:hypothetical protein